ncbi:type II secretion system protein N [Marinicella rhabdoformis]|uniref:type II secretion system protein N n=1 Tax=Marinicella rhabdoformis TaxID=2580566 RepID=UPI0015D074ED|nr:type II secretion system protein N [Marinicella rhabdoformis]
MFGKFFKLVFILIILSVIAVAVTPLNLYYDKASKHLKPLVMTGVGGTAVKGSAEKLKYQQLPLGEAEWLLYPNWFNSLGGKLRVRGAHHDLTAALDHASEARVVIQSLRGYIDWSILKPFLHMRYGQMEGYLNFDMSRLRFEKNGGLKGASGSITLQDFKMIKPSLKDMGTVTLVFETQQEGMVTGVISSDSAVMTVSGTLFLQPNRWKLSVDIIPKGGHFELDSVLSGVGQARRGGGRRLNLAGFY